MSTDNKLTKEALARIVGESTDVNPIKVTAKVMKANKAAIAARVFELNEVESKASANRIVSMVLEAIGDLDQTPSKVAGSRVLSTVTEAIQDSLIAGNEVTISGFMNFKPATQAAKPARKGRNPQTGEPMDIAATPAKNVVRVKTTAPFKAKLNA